MFDLIDYPTHANYIIELLYKKRKKAGGLPILDATHDVCARNDWKCARENLEETIQSSDETLYASKEEAECAKGMAYTCIGATYVAEAKLSEAVESYRHAQEAFAAGVEGYGEAVSIFAQGLIAHIQREWPTIFARYRRSLELLQRLNADDAARDLRLDIEMRKEDAEKDYRLSRPAGFGNTGVNPGFLEIIPVYQDVSAGAGIWAQSEDDITSYLEVDRFSINDQPHYVINLSNAGGRSLRLAREMQYGASQIRGDSMNKSKVENGDYVIFCKPRTVPFVPQNGDIVAAVTNVGGEREVVVKRFRMASPQVVLEPDSTNQRWESRAYNPTNVDVIGKVVAILKRI